MNVELELLASGYRLLEGPRTDADGALWFSDVYGGTVNRRDPDGIIEVVVRDRRMVGGLLMHANGGFVMTGPSVVLRADIANLDDEPDPPGEAYRIDLDGSVTELYGGVGISNGIGFSPDGRTLYHVDSTSRGIWAHDLDDAGALSNRRHIAKPAFEKGIPDGLCVDTEGNLWVAHVQGGRVVVLDPGGNHVDEIRVPASWVTSCAFGGSDYRDLYIVSADNTDDKALGGCVWRCRPGAAGHPTPLARVG
jgi:sugar lactone lactonase YvrE